MPRLLRTGAAAGLWLAGFALAGAAGEPAAPPTPTPALQRDIEAVNRLLRQRQLQAAPPPSVAPAAARPAPDDGAISRSIERLADEDPAARRAAQNELKAAGAAAVPALIDALEDPEQPIRIGAVTVLGQIRDPRAAEPLAELLDTSAKPLWEALWQALNALKGEAAPALIAALESNDQTTRRRAASLMESIRDPRFTEPLIDTLNKDRSTGVRVQIAAALGQIRDRRACEALLDALHDW